MGAKPSNISDPQTKSSEEDMKHLNQAQRKIYKEQCLQLMKQVLEQNSQQTGIPAATGSTSQTTKPAANGSGSQTANPAANGSTSQTTKSAANGSGSQTANPAATGSTSQTTKPAANKSGSQTANPAATGSTSQTTNPAANGSTSQTANPAVKGSTIQNLKMQKSANPPQSANLPQDKYPQLPQRFSQPNAGTQQTPYLQPVNSNPTCLPQPGYPQQQQFNLRNQNVPQFAQVPQSAYSQQAVPHPGFPQSSGSAQQPMCPQQQAHVTQQPLSPQQRPPVVQPAFPKQPPIPQKPSQRVFPQPAQTPPLQPASNTSNAAKPNLTRPPVIPTAPPAPRDRSQSRSRNVPQAEVRRLQKNQRRQYEQKCKELTATLAVQEPAPNPSLERNRAPYNYTRDDRHEIERTNTSLYPDLSQPTTSGFSKAHNSRFATNKPNSKPPHDFVFDKNPQRVWYGNRHMSPSAPPAPRTRSHSRHRNRDSGGEPNCPTCGAHFGSNIFQCGQGHSSCGQCKLHSRSCKLCGMDLTDIRNFVVKDLSQSKVNCPNLDDGCKLVMKVSDMDVHVKECSFKEQTCPLKPRYGNCRWRGKLGQMSSHFERYHRNRWQDRKGGETPEMQLHDVFSNIHDVHLIVMGFFNFLFYLEVSEADRNIYMAVQLIGTKNSAEKWIYEIHVYNKNVYRRKYTYTDNCTSNVEPVGDVFKGGRCAVLPFAYAETYANNDFITFKVFVRSINERTGAGSNQRGRGRN